MIVAHCMAVGGGANLLRDHLAVHTMQCTRVMRRTAPNCDRCRYALADKIGAAVGASRAAVDAGYCPNDMQARYAWSMVLSTLMVTSTIFQYSYRRR